MTVILAHISQSGRLVGNIKYFRVKLREEVVGHTVKISLKYINGNRITSLDFGLSDETWVTVHYSTSDSLESIEKSIPEDAQWMYIGIQQGYGVREVELKN